MRKFVPRALPYLTGEGDPAPGRAADSASSSWDDWCGEHKRKGNHPAGRTLARRANGRSAPHSPARARLRRVTPVAVSDKYHAWRKCMAPLFIECGMVPLCAGDQTIYFQTALRCSVKLVLHSLNRSCRRLVVCCTSATQQGFPTNVDCDIGNDESMWVCRGEADLFGALHVVFDKNSPIYSVCREPNTAAHDLARALREECLALWRDGGGPQKCLALLDAAPCPSLLSDGGDVAWVCVGAGRVRQIRAGPCRYPVL